MPRPGQPPPSTLRNRNRITNKTRLKIVHGNIDVDQIIPDEDEEKNRLILSVAGVDQEDANEHHLQAVLSQAASQAATGKAPKSNEQPDAFIPIPEHSGFADDYATLYPEGRWIQPVSYVQSSSVVEEYISAALADGCTYYMDERDKEWLDRNNEEARGEGTSAQGSMLTSNGRISARSAAKGKGKEAEDVQPSFMSEDEFELVMGLFEKITQEKTEFLHHSLESGQMHFPDFSEYQEVLSVPLPPATFASYSPPSWLPQPPHLVRLARIVYPYWKERCLERAGRRIIPALNFDESDTLNESYVCFRRRETKAVRKTRASQATSSDKLSRLQSEFEYPLQLATQLLAREHLKRDSARQSHHVWNLRMKMVDLKIKNPTLGDKTDEELLVDKERPTRKSDSSSRVRLSTKSETSAQPSPPVREIVRPKDRYASYQGKIEQMLQIRKEQDLQWEDYVDTGYVQSTITPYGSRLFKYINAPRSSSGQSSSSSDSAGDSAPRRPIRLRYGRGGRTFVDRRQHSSHEPPKWRRRFMNDDEEDVMEIDTTERDEDFDRRLSERWKYDADDGPPHGPNGADEQDRVLVDDFDSKYISNLLDQSDLSTLMTDFTIPIIRDGKKENYIPYRLGMTPSMMPGTPRPPSQPQGPPVQGVTPVAQQVHAHQSVPISQQLKLPSSVSSQHMRVPGTNQAVAGIVPQPAASVPAAPASAPRPTVIPSPQVTHNGRPAMNMPRVDMMKLAANHSLPSALQSKIESLSQQPDMGNINKPPSDDPHRAQPQPQVHAQTPQQDQTPSQLPPTNAVNGLHPAYAALANANPAAYNISHYITHYPANPASSGLNNQQLQHLKSVFHTANAGGSPNYNSALYSQLQMSKNAGAVVNGGAGVPNANGSPNMHNYAAANLQLPPGRPVQRVASGASPNGTSSSPARPTSTVNGVQQDSNTVPSPHMLHALVPGEHIPTRTPSANGSRTGFRSSSNGMPTGAQIVYGPNSIQQQQQLLQMHSQSPPQATYNSPHSYSLSPSPPKMQPASIPNTGNPMMQQQQQQVVGNSQGVY
ncbi:enhancer of polycomb-like-domain-containing protein [Lentinula raphanica]|uniref:Enhancer of polycomb-like protein n=1 Tax=Lentinula raphanica TaxID=153919 RepID=A0AA38NXR5_9AGAR|nr:enhancer of polycomb-like-domain-containing protein [Lentinula raphanica]KAJ3832593.1 enhancer of polycomb-like-domain-containing protein [Lentinula raphanica]